MEVTAPAREAGTDEIRLEVYVLEPSLLTGGEAPATGAEIRLDERIALRLLGAERYAPQGGPHVVSLAVELAGGAPPAALAEPLWRFLRRRRGGRGIVTARVVRRRAAGGERHELWVAIPLGSDRRARRRLESFFAETLAPAAEVVSLPPRRGGGPPGPEGID